MFHENIYHDYYLVKAINPLSANPTKIVAQTQIVPWQITDELFECA